MTALLSLTLEYFVESGIHLRICYNNLVDKSSWDFKPLGIIAAEFRC